MIYQSLQPHLVLKVKDSNCDVDYNKEIWILSKDIKLNIRKLERHFDPELFNRIKITLGYCLENFSSATTRKYYYALKKYADFSGGYIVNFNMTDLNQFYNNFNIASYTHVQSIKYFVKSFILVNKDLYNNEILQCINEWRLFSSNKNKVNVGKDPKSNPFEKEQVKYLLKKTKELYLRKEISAIDYCIFILITYSGTRPKQLALLKCCDLFKINKKAYLRLPRMKQKLRFREEFETIAISNHLYNELDCLRTMYTKYIESKSNIKTDKNFLENFPLIIDNHFFHSKFNTENLLYNDFMNVHLTSKKVTARIKYVYSKIEKKQNLSEHEINARKLRTTLATRAAEKGYNILTISKMLDHTNTRSVHSYAKINKENAYRINKYLSDKVFTVAMGFILKEKENLETVRGIFDILSNLLKFVIDYFDKELINIVENFIKKAKKDIINSLLIKEVEHASS